MRPIQTFSLLACLLLFAIAGEAASKEIRHAAPEASDAADAVNVPADRGYEGDVDGAVAASHAAQRTPKPAAAAPTTATRAASDGRTLPSRFHSFLPGMFR